jgi:hypothetical protein
MTTWLASDGATTELGNISLGIAVVMMSAFPSASAAL